MEFQEILSLLLAIAEPTNILSFLGVFSVIAKALDFDKADKVVKELEHDPGAIKSFISKVVTIINLLGLAKKVKK